MLFYRHSCIITLCLGFECNSIIIVCSFCYLPWLIAAAVTISHQLIFLLNINKYVGSLRRKTWNDLIQANIFTINMISPRDSQYHVFKKNIGCKITNALEQVRELLVLMKLSLLQIGPNIVPEVPGFFSQGATFRRHAKTLLHSLWAAGTSNHRPAVIWNTSSGRSGLSVTIPEHLVVFHVCWCPNPLQDREVLPEDWWHQTI